MELCLFSTSSGNHCLDVRGEHFLDLSITHASELLFLSWLDLLTTAIEETEDIGALHFAEISEDLFHWILEFLSTICDDLCHVLLDSMSSIVDKKEGLFALLVSEVETVLDFTHLLPHFVKGRLCHDGDLTFIKAQVADTELNSFQIVCNSWQIGYILECLLLPQLSVLRDANDDSLLYMISKMVLHSCLGLHCLCCLESTVLDFWHSNRLECQQLVSLTYWIFSLIGT